MSHFSVVVVTDKLDEAELSRKLQPFHEFECTGTSDEYVLDVDKTEEARAEYEAYKITRWKDGAGELHDPSDVRFYREPTPEEVERHGMGPGRKTMMGSGASSKISWSSRDWGDGKGHRAKVHLTAEEAGMVELELAAPVVMSFSAFLTYYYGIDEEAHVYDEEDVDREDTHKYGYVVMKKRDPSARKVMLDDDRRAANDDVLKYINRTNPNKQWDWWVLGGRYNGRLRVKPSMEPVQQVAKGRGGLMTPVDEDPLALDYVRVGDIDFEAMYEATKQARVNYVKDAFVKIREAYAKEHGGTILTDEDITEHWNLYRAFKQQINTDWYGEWRAYKAPGTEQIDMRFEEWLQTVKGEPEIAVGLATYGHVDRHLGAWGAGLEAMDDIAEYTSRGTPFRSYAFLAGDGTWNQKGSMGWFGMSHDEVGKDAWEETYTAFLKDLVENHPDKYLAVVDCHI